MAKGDKADTVLILEDEPEHLRWVKEYFSSKRLKVEFVRTLRDALSVLDKREYRLILVDLEVPSADALTPKLLQRLPLAVKYAGIALALIARNKGYGAHSVIAFTVHDDEAAGKELGKMHCRYVLKGRPQAFKSVITACLEPPPRSAREIWKS